MAVNGYLIADIEALWNTYLGRIEKVEIRIDGIGKNCEKRQTTEKALNRAVNRPGM